MNNRVLIIGALGQLGGIFINALLKRGDFVLASDIHAPNPNTLGCDFIILDALNEKKINEIILKHNISQVYNFAAVLSAKGETDPMKTWEINMGAFLNVVKASLGTSVNCIFWPSSIAVFSEHSGLDLVRNEVPMFPTTMYGVTKLAGEKAMSYFNTKGLIDIRSIRFPGIVSSSEPGGGTTDYVVEMLNAAKQNMNYISPLREDTVLPMMHVEDAVSATLKLMDTEREKISISGAYNLGSFETSPKQWSEIIASLGYELKLEFNEDFRQSIADSWPKKIDDTLFRKDISWLPKFDAKSTAEDILRLI
mgnify:FL=1